MIRFIAVSSEVVCPLRAILERRQFESRGRTLAAAREVSQLRMSVLANGIEGPDIRAAAGTPLRCSVVHTGLPDLAG